MTTTTLNWAPADLLGRGAVDVRRCSERDNRIRIGVSPAPRVTSFPGAGAPAVAVLAGTAPYAHNSNGTTLGIPPSGRPLS